jgi:hypothetical protein
MSTEREQYTTGYGCGETFTSRGWATADEIDGMRTAWQKSRVSRGRLCGGVV